MNTGFIIDQLAVNLRTFEAIFSNVPAEQVRWKPEPAKWSLLEVVNHLYDEEMEDFGFRLRSVLEDPKESWPRIAPEKWVTERAYAQRDYEDSVKRFFEARTKSIEWLRGLSQPDWKSAYEHPEIGPMSAEMILANWLAHDYLHIRQIVVLKLRYLSNLDEEISLEYAGTL